MIADTEDLTFGYWVRRRRKALDLTQDQLADRVGCAAVTIRTIESGMRRPSPPMAERLAACLLVDPGERAAFLRAARAVFAEDDLPNPATAPIMQGGPSHMRAEPPAPANRLIGRDRELGEVAALLQQSALRMVTLTGLGGVGKTRLAAALATELRPMFQDGVGFVSLAHVIDPTTVAAVIVQTLGLPEIGTYTALDRLTLALSGRNMLLVIDNFEHVIDAAPQMAVLLASAPRLKLLVSSQAALRISGEHEYPLAPLALPAEVAGNLAELGDSAAVQLFVERARAIRPQFELHAENAAMVAAICVRLDGLPLAIELAAARVALLTPQALLERLNRRLALLVGGPRDLPVRQQTLRSAIDWSYDLLAAEDQQLLARLGVFSGSFTLAAIHALSGIERDAESSMDGSAELIEQSLERIINHSLVVRIDAGSEPRFVMLGLIRDYAYERLIGYDEEGLIRARHAAFYCAIAEQAEPQLFGHQQQVWLERLQQEWPNMRAALEWCAAAGSTEQPNMLARMTVALWWFWYTQGYYAEGRSWLEQVFGGKSDLLAGARAGYCAAALAYRQGAYRQAEALAEQSRVRCEGLGDTLGMAFAYGILALASLVQGDQDTAERMARAAQPVLRAAGHTWGVAATQIILGAAARFAGDYRIASTCLDESLGLFRQLGDRWGVATALSEQAIVVAWLDGDWARASGLLEESLGLFRALGDRASIGHALHRLGRAARLCGEHNHALRLLREQIELFRSLGDRAGQAYAIWEAAALMAADAQHDQAARLFGLAELLTHTIHLGLASDLLVEYAAARQMTQHVLGEQAFAAALMAGRDADVDQALGAPD